MMVISEEVTLSIRVPSVGLRVNSGRHFTCVRAQNRMGRSEERVGCLLACFLSFHVKMIMRIKPGGSIQLLVAGIIAVSISLITLTNAKLDKSLLWGTYRPQIYFGIRAAEPGSFLSGLVWFSPNRPDAILQARHECSESDKIDGYGWIYHDGRSLAIQEIKDTENNYLLETSWIKTDLQGTGSWAIRVQGTVLDPSKPASLSTIYYSALESDSSFMEPTFEQEKYVDGLPSKPDSSFDDIDAGRFITAEKASATLPGFSMRFSDTPGANNNPANPDSIDYIQHEEEFQETRPKWHYLGLKLPQQHLWRGKEVVQSDISSSVKAAYEAYGSKSMPFAADLLTLSDSIQPMSNFFALQRSFSGNFSFDVFYDAKDAPKSTLLDGNGIGMALTASKQAYSQHLELAFPVPESDKVLKGKKGTSKTFVRELTSQIVGSIGYYFGSSIVDRSFTHDYDDIAAEPREANPQLTPPAELLTATPSRSKFPRGFYWDEGFHLAHISAWDPNLSLEVLRSWLNLIDEDGWVAREQILGEEARSRVPPEFQTQYPTYANPPTLAMTVTDYINRLAEKHQNIFPLEADMDAMTDPDQVNFDDSQITSSSYIEDPVLARQFLLSIYPKLRQHYLWFRQTQRGQIKEWDRSARARNEAFRWRGRTRDHVLTSGLDDYPRASTPHVGELHVDLMCWMGSFAEAMVKMATALGEEDDMEEYEKHYKGIVTNVVDLHWNEEEKMFCDASVNEQDESFHVCHRGYLSIFPLTSQLLPVDSPQLGSILDMMHDKNHIWSSFGLRSLSKQDPFYGKGEDYWRGPVWVPMNYLALRALKKKYASQPGPFQAQAAKIYTELRENLVENVWKEYERTGYTWEQYHPETGLGQRSHPFTGWTSMAAMILAELY